MQGNASAASLPPPQPASVAAFKSTFLPAVYGFVFCVGLVTNVAAIRACCRRGSRPWSGLAVYTFNLALADLMYVTSLPPFIHYYTRGSEWTFGDWPCRAGRFVFHANLSASALFLACVSAHRYAGIVHPLWSRGRLRARTARVVSASVWLVVVLLLLPMFYFVREGVVGGGGGGATPAPEPRSSSLPLASRDRIKCFDGASDADLRTYLPYSVALSVTTFVVPFAVAFACYGLVASVLLGNRRVGARARARALTLVAVVLLLFSVSFLPYHVTRNLNLASRLYLRGVDADANGRIYAAYQVCRGLASLNSCFNPIVYFLARDGGAARQHVVRLALRDAAPPGRSPLLLLRRKATVEVKRGSSGEGEGGEEGEEGEEGHFV